MTNPPSIEALLQKVSEQDHHLTELQLFCLFNGLSPERFHEWQRERAAKKANRDERQH